jgi:hypothetical protein
MLTPNGDLAIGDHPNMTRQHGARSIVTQSQLLHCGDGSAAPSIPAE